MIQIDIDLKAYGKSVSLKPDHGQQITQITSGEEGDCLYIGDVRGGVHLCTGGEYVKTVKAHTDCITFMEWSEKKLFVLGKNANIKIFSA